MRGEANKNGAMSEWLGTGLQTVHTSSNLVGTSKSSHLLDGLIFFCNLHRGAKRYIVWIIVKKPLILHGK